MEEVFRPIRNYEGLYEVSNIGDVFSVKKGKILKPSPNTRGYLQVDLVKNRKHRYAYVHRLVAEAFLDNSQNLPEVNHKDENILNNSVDNLEWCSAHYNLTYGTRIQRIVQHLQKAVAQIGEDGNIIRTFPSLAEAERVGGYNHSNVSNCCNGKFRTAYGYKWRFV